MEIQRFGRYWAVYEANELVCVCVYKKGAAEVIRRLTMKGDANYGKAKQARNC